MGSDVGDDDVVYLLDVVVWITRLFVLDRVKSRVSELLDERDRRSEIVGRRIQHLHMTVAVGVREHRLDAVVLVSLISSEISDVRICVPATSANNLGEQRE